MRNSCHASEPGHTPLASSRCGGGYDFGATRTLELSYGSDILTSKQVGHLPLGSSEMIRKPPELVMPRDPLCPQRHGDLKSAPQLDSNISQHGVCSEHDPAVPQEQRLSPYQEASFKAFFPSGFEAGSSGKMMSHGQSRQACRYRESSREILICGMTSCASNGMPMVMRVSA